MKKIVIILFFFALASGFAQERNAPLLGRPTGGGAELILWQYSLNSYVGNTLESAGADKYKISVSSSKSYGADNPLTSAEGYRIVPVRVLDTLLDGKPIGKSIFPKLALRVADAGSLLDTFTTIDPIDFSQVNLDSTATKRIVLRNIGQSTLYLANGTLFDTTTSTLLEFQNVGETYILRSDPEMNNEIAWQTRYLEPTPIQGDPLLYADRTFDDLDFIIGPGDTASVYIDTRPEVVGRKNDTLHIDFSNGFNTMTYDLPMILESTWTLDYKISSLKARPVTPSHDVEFHDTILVSNNLGRRTRVASMRLVFQFDPQNIFITGFELNPDFFSSEWTYNIQDYRQSEKDGIILIEAFAEGNIALKQTAQSSEDLNYFEGGSNGEESVLCILKGKQLLGASDTTFVDLDDTQSQHNFSTDYLMARDAALVADASPFMTTTGGTIVSDSLLFSEQLAVRPPDAQGRIVQMYPNPVGNSKFITVVVDIEIEEEIEGRLVFVNPYTGREDGGSEKMSFKPGTNIVALRVPEYRSETYLVALEFKEFNDAKLLNIIK
jgi:hypothetical protein